MIRLITLNLFLFIICSGCEKVFDFPENGKFQKIPVIEAIITNKSGYQKIRVSYSVPFGDSLSSEPIANAIVKIADDAGDTAKFTYLENGWYTNNNFIAVPQKEYKILVQIDTILYQAVSKLGAANELDSLSYSFYRKDNTKEAANYLKIYAGITDPDNTKYYQIHIYKNRKLFTTGNNAVLFSDVGTKSINGIELDIAFAKNDTLNVELYSLTREMYDYYLYIFNDILYNHNNDLDFKTNPTIQFKPKALGYFQVSMLSRKSIIIE